ncbi:MAG: sigma-54-dependent Fis family transcriptional regulator [Magnetococcales bacterium]|nr:sigma-54-dependent Fis family transcriptional regulator [Magnetococcales bacterium]
MANSNSAIVGSSKIIRATLARAEKVARTQLPVLITGESGTGKELFARHVHDHSSRAGRPYVAINCASVPSELLESEFFGYKQGAFSGAKDNRDGLFVQADGGTLFLDEIGDMPLPLQAKILRVLQEGEVRPLGAKAVQKVNVRIVAATHQDLEKMVAEGKFRADLVFRLRGYALHLPPLRDRERDVIALTRMILKSQPEFASKDLSHDLQELLLTYPWPGNVRELRNAVLAAAVDAPRSIGANHLRPYLADNGPTMTLVAPMPPVVDRLWMELADGKQITLAQLHYRLRIPKTTLHRHISHLVEQGRICRHEEGGGVLPQTECNDCLVRVSRI